MSEDTTQKPSDRIDTGLTLVDIKNLYAIIDMAAKRGAFAESSQQELQIINAVVNKTRGFLIQHIDNIPNNEAQAEPTEEQIAEAKKAEKEKKKAERKRKKELEKEFNETIAKSGTSEE